MRQTINDTNIQLGTYNNTLNFNPKTNRKLSHTSLLEELITMPRSWLLNLHRAANNVDEELLDHLIEEVPEHKEFLSKGLAELVQNFRLDIILKFTQQILREKVESRE